MTISRIPSVEGGIQPTIFDAKGDLLTATANDTPARLAVGADNTKLVADSTAATGLKYVGFQGCSVYNSAAQGIATATLTALTFDNENFDTDGFHSTSSNTSRITIPTGMAGKYLVTTTSRWDASLVGIRQNFVYVNGVSVTTTQEDASNNFATLSKSVILNLSVGDYIQFYVNQTQGSLLYFYGRNEEQPFQVQYLGA